MWVLRTFVNILGSTILAILALASAGAASGWILGLIVGPPTGVGLAAAYGAAGGLVLGGFVRALLRSPKGIQMGIGTIGIGAMLGAGAWKLEALHELPGWLFGAAVWGAGMGAIVAGSGLILLVGMLASGPGDRAPSRKSP